MTTSRLIAIVVTIIVGPIAYASARAALWVTPRETCQWRVQDFCSDYGPVYAAIAAIGVCIIIASWALTLRRRKG